jgi:antirestriction protein ArdC
MTNSTAARPDVYTRITAVIVSQLEAGTRPWQRPWSEETVGGRIFRPLRACGTSYRGVNVLSLWLAANEKGYASPYWFTFNQAKALGGFVRKGEHGSLVVYANSVKKTVTGVNSDEVERDIFFMRGYTVFNAGQVDGLPERFAAPPQSPACPEDRVSHADAFFRATGAEVRHGGDRAYYAAGCDYVQMPPSVAFKDRESYYATLAHEVAHWTKHPKRLDRGFGQKTWGDEGYAREELVAEIAAAFLCADLGLTLEPREDHAAYLASWLTVLRNDKRAIFQAAAYAQKAADYLHALQPKPAD